MHESRTFGSRPLMLERFAKPLKRAVSIRVLLVAYGLAVTLPLALFAANLLYRSASAERIALEQRILQAASSLAEHLDRDLDRGITLLHVLATSSALQREDWPGFYEQAKAALKDRAYIIVVDANGRQIVNTYVPFGEAPEFAGDPATVERILATNKPYVSDLFRSLVVGKPVYNISIPIETNGEVRYILRLGLLPDILVQILSDEQLDPAWVGTIWDRKGFLLARSRDQERFLGSQAPREFELNRKGVFVTTNLDSEKVLLAATNSNYADWRIAVSVPEVLAQLPYQSYLLIWGGAAALAIALAIILALAFGSLIERPLVRAAQAARVLGRGGGATATFSGLREIDDLTNALQDASKRHDVMMAELTHRVKNLLAVVQSLVLQTVTEDEVSGDVRTKIRERIAALARAHDMLVNSDWAGAALEDIVRAELETYLDRVDVKGPFIFLKPGAVQSFAMVLHELATNAAKHGAFSAPQGSLLLNWYTRPGPVEEELCFHWQETDGPPVASPRKKGLGLQLLNFSFGAHRPVIHFAPEGFSLELCVPLREVC